MKRKFPLQLIGLPIFSSMIPILFIAISLPACRSAPKEPKSGVPQHVRSGSFKVSMDSEKVSLDEQQAKLKTHANEIARIHGCGVESVEAIAWERGALTARLASSYHVMLSNCRLNEEQLRAALTEFESKEGIETVEADAIVKVKAVENDPLKSRQYHLAKINREATCDSLGGKRGHEVVVAIIDSGSDPNHPDLKDSYFRDSSGKVVGANFVGKGARGAPDANWGDGNGHGTHVAGLVGATAHNGQGVVGVAACTNVKIMPIRVMGNDGGGSTVEIERGVQWAIAQGADVINLSLGGMNYYSQKRDSHPSPVYLEAANRGVIVFAAAGNESTRIGGRTAYGYAYTYPGAYDNVISVAATDIRDVLAGFSNRGDTVDIAAPGVADLSTLVGGGYGVMSGTSMASPVAAGAYALVLSMVRQTRQERIPYIRLMPVILKATRTQNLAKSDVISGGVLDTNLLLSLTKKEISPEQQRPIASPGTDTPGQPIEEQPAAAALKFVGLQEQQEVKQSFKISITGWPKGQTAAIYLYWKPTQSEMSYTFAILTREHLSPDGNMIVTPSPYFLVGEGTLVAEGINTRGQRNGLASIHLRGF